MIGAATPTVIRVDKPGASCHPWLVALSPRTLVLIA